MSPKKNKKKKKMLQKHNSPKRVFKEVSNLIVELVLDLIHLSHNSHGAERRLLADVRVGGGHP